MKIPRGWKIEKNVPHDPAPALFAWEFAKARAKKHGLKWKCKVHWGYSRIPGYWHGYGARWKHGGTGKVRLYINHKLPHRQFRDRRFQNYNDIFLQGSQETIVFLFAHEFGHIIGWDGDKAGETACNNFGYDCVLAWRARECEHPAALI